MLRTYQGDLILVQENKDSNKWFEGHVHVVRRDEVGLCFHTSFGNIYSPSAKYRVRFKLNRIPVRRQHMAMDTAFNEDRVLFPRVDHLTSIFRSLPIEVFNPLISSNPPQLQAVTSILNLRPGSPPFVIFGPYVMLYILLSLATEFVMQPRHWKDCHRRGSH
jgi:helicase MOV-10